MLLRRHVTKSLINIL